jgi:cytochrome c oxidase subunit 2
MRDAQEKWGGCILITALASSSGGGQGDTGSQSALEPAGQGSSLLAELFWGMTWGAALIWLIVIGLALYATYFARTRLSASAGRLLIIGGGVAFPFVVLSGLLIYSLSLLPDFLEPAPEGALQIHVTGYQWWWRVRYPLANGSTVELANELRLPLGEPVQLELESSDVIHSFWIPALGGKVDMIPGRRTRLTLTPTKAGLYRGVCAEYCGTSHALMGLFVIVEPRSDLERWLESESALARSPSEPRAKHGEELFVANGCGACHTIRGTAADGVIGPDLTHVGSRRSLGAGALPSGSDALARFIADTGGVKPNVHMPAFGMLPRHELRALALYLEGLQ